MKNASQCARKLSTLLRRLPAAEEPERPTGDDPVAELVFSFMLWESNTGKARTAYANIFRNVVDANDLRVCMPHEVVEFIGPRYPRALERCQRLRAALRDIYVREHAVSLQRLRVTGKRDARKYLDSLDGMVPFVSARVALLCFDAHAVPVDDQLRTQLIEAGAADVSTEVEALASWLEHHVMAANAVQAHFTLQAWIDEGGKAPPARRGARTASAAKAASNNSRAKTASAPRKTTRRKASAP